MMQEIIIDEKFKRILPALDEIAYNDLERDILIHGCLMPLVLWDGILIDGYHRYGILMKHDLPFNTISMEFDSRDEVIDWIIEHHEYVKLLQKVFQKIFQKKQADTKRLPVSFNKCSLCA